MVLAYPGTSAVAHGLSRRNLLRILWGVGALALAAQIGAIFLDFFRPRKLGTFGSVVFVISRS